MRAKRQPGSIRPDDASHAAALFRALSDPHRLAILASIAGANEPVCVCNLGDGLPLLQPTVSHHLKVLRDAGLVIGQRHGTWVYYRLADRALDRLGDHIALATQKEWTYEDAPVAPHKQARRKRGLLSKLAQRRSA
ncbi:MAG TPA: metalloregulator ArsR/SmtB family transcription factor [Candidatus Eremiobacteraceae bacterium]|nr:metalloregulator ArsR/SmtB family transcription factor [Candidatus Eremiobacteraceae bacterium]